MAVMADMVLARDAPDRRLAFLFAWVSLWWAWRDLTPQPDRYEHCAYLTRRSKFNGLRLISLGLESRCITPFCGETVGKLVGN